MLANSTGGKINDVGLVDGEAKRIYVYSTIDALVGWRDAEKHVEGARKNGTEVTMLKEYTTKQCSIWRWMESGIGRQLGGSGKVLWSLTD